jgi:CheY-like chemotaxis protein
VKETAQFALSGANISCHFDIPQDLWSCNFDKNQISQVIDNLIINAQQAMPIGGTIELAARNIAFAKKEHLFLEKGKYVKISVKDNGIGIPKEQISRIFDPFFTTKTKGHGLGLATSHSIVNKHGGYIDVESELGKGSIFHVYLPACAAADSSTVQELPRMHKGSGTFLIMDDENVIREAVHGMVASLGYTVVCTENGKEAVDVFAAEAKSNQRIVGMILDLTIPGAMGGKAAVEKIRKMNAGAEIPIFVASGYSEDSVMRNPSEYGFTASICKPFTIIELAEMLNKFMK